MKTGLKTNFRHIQWYALFSVLKIVDNSTFEFWANMTHFLSCFWMGWRDDDSIFRVGWVKTTVKVSLSLNFVSLKSIKTSLHQFANLQFCHKKWLINIYFVSRKYSWVKTYDSNCRTYFFYHPVEQWWTDVLNTNIMTFRRAKKKNNNK